MIYIKLPATHVKKLNAVMANQKLSEELIAEVQASVVTDMIADITGGFVIIEDSYYDDTSVVELDLETLPTFEAAKAHFANHVQDFELEFIACDDAKKVAIQKPVTEWDKNLIEHYIATIALYSLSKDTRLINDKDFKDLMMKKILEALASWDY